MVFLKAKYQKRLLEWIAALESGKYRKGKYRLKTSQGRFCCLGVACEVYGLVPSKSFRYWEYDGNERILPPEVQKWLGLKSKSGCFDWGNLAQINDNTRGFKAVLKILKDPPRSLFANDAILPSILRKESKFD